MVLAVFDSSRTFFKRVVFLLDACKLLLTTTTMLSTREYTTKLVYDDRTTNYLWTKTTHGNISPSAIRALNALTMNKLFQPVYRFSVINIEKSTQQANPLYSCRSKSSLLLDALVMKQKGSNKTTTLRFREQFWIARRETVISNNEKSTCPLISE